MVNSKTLSLGALFAAVGGVLAQTAPGFPVSGGSTLNVTFGRNVVSPAGELIPRGDTASPPNLTTPVFTTGGRVVLLMVDSDVPRNGSRVELLHWLASNVTLGPGNSSTLSVPSNPEAAYLQPSPPVGDSPHAYTFLIFEQPLGFRIPSNFTGLLQTRVFFNTSAFVREANLTTPLAANYIRVQNISSSATTTFPPPRPTNATGNNATTSIPSSFPGGAVGLTVGGGAVFWGGVVASFVAGAFAYAL